IDQRSACGSDRARAPVPASTVSGPFFLSGDDLPQAGGPAPADRPVSGTLRRMSLASRSSRRHHRALQHRAIALVVLASVLGACVFHGGGSNGSPGSIPSVLEPGDVVAPSPAPGSSDQTIALARTKIKHLGFVHKENPHLE